MLETLNRARAAYRSGDSRSAFEFALGALLELDSSGAILNQSSFVVGVDAATLKGLALLGRGQTEAGRTELEGMHLSRFPNHADPSTVIALMPDPESRNLFAFGQISLVELAANALDPPQRVEELLQTLWSTAESAGLAMIEQFWRFQSARCYRMLGQWRRAIDEWLMVARETARLLDQTAELPAGYPPGRSCCEAALTLEGLPDREFELRMVVDELETKYYRHLDAWDSAVLAGIRIRLGETKTVPWDAGVDEAEVELQRSRIDAWYCSLPAPTDAETARFLRSLAGAPLAVQLTYPWRYLRASRAAGRSQDTRIFRYLENVLANMDEGIFRDFGLPHTVGQLLESATFSRCLAI